MTNNEPTSYVESGWKVVMVRKSNGVITEEMDLSADATKMFHNQDPSEVHLDMNVIQPEAYYYISHYVRGTEDYIIKLYVEDTIQVYVGQAPQNGACTTDVLQAWAGINLVTLSTDAWEDSDGIF